MFNTTDILFESLTELGSYPPLKNSISIIRDEEKREKKDITINSLIILLSQISFSMLTYRTNIRNIIQLMFSLGDAK